MWAKLFVPLVSLLLSDAVPQCWCVEAIPDTKEDAIKQEIKNLDGSWSLISSEFGQFPLASDVTMINIKGDKWTWRFKNPDVEPRTSTFQIDPTQKPKSIDLTEGIVADKVVALGIYEINGDELSVCLCGIDRTKPQKRPDNFEAKGKEVILLKFRRSK
jgi:uncharacterized protein (TIGR03067 family)